MTPTFEEIKQTLSGFDKINFGGCGLAALALYDAAIKEGKNAEIVYFYTSRFSGFVKMNEDFKKGVTDTAQSASHIMVKINDLYYDALHEVKGESVYKVGNWTFEYSHQVTREHLISSLLFGGWNDSFNRKHYLPILNNFVGYELIPN